MKKWTEKEVKHAAKIMRNAEKNKHVMIKLLDELVHWIMVLLVLSGNFMISGFLVMIYPMVSDWVFYIVTILLAMAFGYLIEMPLRDMKRIHKHKWFFSRIMLPVLALINIAIFFGVKNIFSWYSVSVLELNALLAGLVYGVFFLVPHFLSKKV